MAHLPQYTYPGFGEDNTRDYWYSQAVRVENQIHIAGQGGWDRETSVIKPEIGAQIDQAFENVDFVLKLAGGKGWSQVFRINSYHVDLSDEVQTHMVRNFKKWFPNHHPTWTCVQIGRLGGGRVMQVEIEVVAHDPEGAEKLRQEQSK